MLILRSGSLARPVLAQGARLVVKVGTASLVGKTGEPVEARLAVLCEQIAKLRGRGIQVMHVSSGAIAAGLPALGLPTRAGDIPSL